MRGLVAVTAMASLVAGLVAFAPRLRGTSWAAWIRKLAWSWAGVPSGPLGWVSSNWIMPVLHGPIYPMMARELDLQPDDDLLEVACGSGIFLAREAAHVRHVAGLDLSDIQVGLARRRLADRITAGTAEIIKGDAAALPWDDGRFSVVTCMGSVEAFPDPGAAIAEMYRVLRPGGRAVVCLGARVADGTETHRILGAIWVWSEHDARQLVEHAGFAEVAVSYASTRGDNRAVNLLGSLTAEEEMRVVRGVKSGAEAPAGRTGERIDLRIEEPARELAGVAR